MRKLFDLFLSSFLWFLLSLRYKVEIKGLENLTPEKLNKPGGVLFLPNHPALLVDPALVTLAARSKFELRPLIIEYMFFTTGAHWLMKYLKALPIPSFETSSNSIKRKRAERVFQTVIKDIQAGDNFLIYPGARLKHTNIEKIGGVSGVHRILQEAPDTNVVLVRTNGLWGSSFSRALIGKVPPLFSTVFHGVKVVLKNLIFFTPRRKVVIEFEPAPADFPYEASRLDLNRYLEKYYNRPDGFSPQEGEYPGESLMLVSYSRWKEELPKVFTPTKRLDHEEISLDGVSKEVQEKIYDKISELTELDVGKIDPEMSLSSDLGMDSLDTSELAAFLQDQFSVGSIPVAELSTVKKVLAIASKKVVIEEEVEEEEKDVSKWKHVGPKFRAQIAHGETIPEVFLHNCERMGNAVACSDMRSGVLTYSRMKIGVILLAEYIRTQPGKYIGIMLPSSVGAFLTILACQLAGKIPLMVNWTIGPRHLQSVSDVSKVEVVLSSWAFLERLDQVDLSGIDEKLVMLETVRQDFTLWKKIKAFVLSKRKASSIMKHFHADKISKEDAAVLLFTSGTESMPKGVPLSHSNLLSNLRAGFEMIPLFSDDVIYGVLPPFHSFGFTISGLMGLLSGIKTTYFPDPKDGARMAKGFQMWGATIFCGAPTFIKALIKAATPEQLRTMRVCVTGAEKAPPELFQALAEMGKEQCLCEGYGITECSPILTANIPGKPPKGVGQPLPGVEIIIVHQDTMEPASQGTRGLILARGPNVFSGYINPGLSSPFVKVKGKEWYNTGDLGYLDEEGRLTISGRLKRFIKVGSEMISLPAVEEALLHAAPEKEWPVSEEGPILAICGKEKIGEKPRIMMFSTFPVEVEEINEILRNVGFSNLVKVTHVKQIDAIPVMGTGKIHYRQLEENYLGEDL